MSLRELWNEFRAARERNLIQNKRDLTLAWHIAALSRQKRLPELTDLLNSGSRRKIQTPAEQRAWLHMLSEYIGVPLRKVKKAKVKRP